MEHEVETVDIVAGIETADAAATVAGEVVDIPAESAGEAGGLGVDDCTGSADDDEEGTAEASFALWAAARSRSFC